MIEEKTSTRRKLLRRIAGGLAFVAEVNRGTVESATNRETESVNGVTGFNREIAEGVGLANVGQPRSDVTRESSGAGVVGEIQGGLTGGEEILLGSVSDDATVLDEGRLAGLTADAVERGDRHGSQEADDDDNDHDFDEGEALFVAELHVCNFFLDVDDVNVPDWNKETSSRMTW